MASFEINIREEGAGILLISVKGYFDEECGEDFSSKLDFYFRKGIDKVILDIAGCSAINSLGVVAILRTVIFVVDTCKGKFLIAGTNKLTKKVFEITGVVTMAKLVASIEEGLEQLKLG
ncbi:MAG: STAS domain-containing protein [Candidatus Riflebacteria bacterium]|nr:STAS domain-containing protein [Candidatus Riflebacteria bacterium]